MAGYYNPGDAGGNVFVAPQKSLRRSANNQLLPVSIQTRTDRTVDHLSAWQLFEDKGLGNPGSPSMPDELARESGIDPMRIRAGDLSRENTGAVTKAVKNLEYEHRMSDPNVRSVNTEQTLRPYNTIVPTAAAAIPGPGANYGTTSLESLAGHSLAPQAGYTPSLGPKRFIEKKALLNPTTGLTRQTAEAFAMTMKALPDGAETSTFIPQKATNAMTAAGETGIPESIASLRSRRPIPAGIKEDGTGNATYLSQEIQRRLDAIRSQRPKPAQIHPSQQNYSFSDGQMRGIEDDSVSYSAENAPRTYDWKKIGKIGGLAGLAALGLYLVTR